MIAKHLILTFIAISLILTPLFGAAAPLTDNLTSYASRGDGIKTVYLSSDYLYSQEKINYLLKIVEETEINAVVIDFKDNRLINDQRIKDIIAAFKAKGAYVIGRLVTFQDTSFAKANPDCAIKTKSGEFWRSGRKVWKRYWLDPASPKVLDYTIKVAKIGIDMGFDEINFDYIRFPSDGNMKDMVYPYWDGHTSKYAVMANFFKTLNNELKLYSPKTKLSIDIFGEVFLNGAESGVGQSLEGMSKYFDIICPMAYPSHYKPGIFGKGDPNLDPYDTYHRTLRRGKMFLDNLNSDAKIRPWIQDFSIRNIYGGQKVIYGPKEVRDQIRASSDLGIDGFMLWNANNRYTTGALSPEKQFKTK